MLVVLRGRAQQGRPADVDHLDRVLIGDADACGDGLEGIEADADEIDRSDALLLERGDVVLDSRRARMPA